ncbi:MAG: ABC transporter substrate-binding protein [Anaerolineae bacterium]|nr:ABC transporter substrate-binding protein [Anaerolineae bacterium]
MVKRIVVVVLVAMMAGVPLSHLVSAQADGAIRVLAVESAQEPVEAWVAAFGQIESYTFYVSYVESYEEVLAGVGKADILVYDNFETLPAVLECGVLSRVYVPLPELGLRFVDRNGCDGASADPVVMGGFAHYAVSADGQQVAIDLGLLPDVVEVADQGGVTVEVPQPVRGIASAYGVATYYAYTLGAGERLLAASYIGVRGPAVQDAMRRVDPNFDAVMNAISALNQNEINLEEVAALHPGLILTSARTQWLDAAAELGIPILRFEGETPERLKESMTLIGAVLGPNAAYRAAQFNAYYDAMLAQIANQTDTIEATTTVYFSGTEPLRTASGDMYQTAMVEAAGGESVSKELTGYWNDVNLEQVVVWNPDVIFVPTYGGATVEAITESDEWAVVPAVEAGRVYQLPQFISPWDTPLPDSILGIMWMAETLYPDQVDLGCEAEVEFFYNMFYDYAILAEEVQGLCG